LPLAELLDVETAVPDGAALEAEPEVEVFVVAAGSLVIATQSTLAFLLESCGSKER